MVWAGVVVLLLGLSILSFALIFQGSFFSRNDDEIRSPKILQADYSRWSASLRDLIRLSSSPTPTALPILPPAPAPDPASLRPWLRWRYLPPEGLARSVLARRLPQQIQLLTLQPRRLRLEDDHVSIDYSITLRAKEDILLAPVISAPAQKNQSGDHRRLIPKILFAYDLPP